MRVELAENPNQVGEIRGINGQELTVDDQHALRPWLNRMPQVPEKGNVTGICLDDKSVLRAALSGKQFHEIAAPHMEGVEFTERMYAGRKPFPVHYIDVLYPAVVKIRRDQ